ncbi:MAG: hypothetical protein OEU36_17455 [Gammaproteobacteria bacterium]|nr:hypothetical protein [Gammaproteobacteria bacterium]
MTNESEGGLIEYRCMEKTLKGEIVQVGEYRVIDGQGNVLVRGFFENGIGVGEWTFYNSDGTVKEVIHHGSQALPKE